MRSSSGSPRLLNRRAQWIATHRCSSMSSLRSWRSPVSRRRRNRSATSGSAGRSEVPSGSSSLLPSVFSSVLPPSPAAASAIDRAGAALAHADADLAVVGADVEVVGDDAEDLPAQREALRLELGDAASAGRADEGDDAIVDLEAEHERCAVAAFEQRGAHLVHRDAKILDLFDVVVGRRRDPARHEPRDAHQPRLSRKHELDRTIHPLLIHVAVVLLLFASTLPIGHCAFAKRARRAPRLTTKIVHERRRARWAARLMMPRAG